MVMVTAWGHRGAVGWNECGSVRWGLICGCPVGPPKHDYSCHLVERIWR